MFPCPDFVRQLIEYFRRFFAPVDHDHDADYSPADHDHDADYSPIDHNHDADYSPIDHNHDADYSPIDHNHDSRYYLQTTADGLFTYKVRKIDTYPLTTAYTTSGTSAQNVWSFTYSFVACTETIIRFICSPYQNNAAAACDLVAGVALSGHTTVWCGHIHFDVTGKVAIPSIFSATFADVASGNKTVSLVVYPFAGTWKFADDWARPARMEVIQYN